MGTILSPWKMFWFDEFTSVGLNYGSRLLTPFMYVFCLPFFYAAVFAIPFYGRRNDGKMRSYYMLIGMMLIGLFIEVINITNITSSMVESEAIFFLPPAVMLTSFSLYYLFKILHDLYSGKTKWTNDSNQYTNRKITEKHGITYKYIAIGLVVILVIGAGISVSSFTSDLYGSSEAYFQINNQSYVSLYEGWYHVANFLVHNKLLDIPLYYVSGTGGVYDFGNSSNGNYAYMIYYYHFPLYWLYVYSEGKINDVTPLGAGTPPPLPANASIVLSQYPNYSNVLSMDGYNYRDIYNVYRANGEPAIQVFCIYGNVSTSEIQTMDGSNIFYTGGVGSEENFTVPELSNITDQLTVSVDFSISSGMLKPGKFYDILSSITPTFALGIWPDSIFNQGTSNSSYVPEGSIYTNFGNYSAPGSWQRLNGNVIIKPNTTYVLTLTFDDGAFDLYINGSLIASYIFNYPLYPLGDVVFIDYNINATVRWAGIWNVSLNPAEVGYLTYHDMTANDPLLLNTEN
jgi:hypothetical protein